MIKQFIILILFSALIYSQGPCPGMQTINYGGRIYNTIMIGGQCWLKENLNVGNMLLFADSAKNNEVIEKYCYANQTTNCDKYGALYDWNEAMQYSEYEKSQGICPAGWHIPSIAELSSLYGNSILNYQQKYDIIYLFNNRYVWSSTERPTILNRISDIQIASNGFANFSNVIFDSSNTTAYYNSREYQLAVKCVYNNDVPVPVELMSFTATGNKKGVTLYWKTATEMNNYGFDIERNGVKIGSVAGSGTSYIYHSYSFLDTSGFGTFTYRLKQIDTNGNFKYSNEINIVNNIKPPHRSAL